MSIAEAKGCTSSRQRGSYAHKALLQWLQKCLLAGLVLTSSFSMLCTFAWKAIMFSSPSTHKEEESALRLMVYPLPPTVLRQMEQ